MLIAAAVPVLVIGPAAGVRRPVEPAADHDDCERLPRRADRLASPVLPAFGHQMGPAAELAAVYGIVAVESSFAQFFNPSRLAVLGVVVAPGDLPSASGLLQATSSLAGIIGPPLAAPLLFTLGVQWALLIDASLFALSFLAIRAIQLPGPAAGGTPATPSFRAEFRAGIRFFAHRRALIALCVGVVIATLGTGALNTLMVFFVTGNLHTAARWLGILFAGGAAGFLASTLLRGMHVMIAGITFGPIDAILGVSALLITAGGIAVTALLNGAGHPSASETRTEKQPAPAVRSRS